MYGYVDNFSDGIINDLGQFKIVWNSNLIWITNYIKIEKYEKNKIVFKIKNNKLIVEGVDIFIKMLNKKEMVLSGKFNSVFLEKRFVSDGE